VVAEGVRGVSRTAWALVLVGALCAVVLLARTVPGVAGTVLGGVIVAGLLTLAWRWWREAQEVRLLQAFLKESGGDLNRDVPLNRAVARAKLQDPRPVVDRLLFKWHIGPSPKRRIVDIPPEEWETEKHKLTDKDQFDPDYFYLNHEGLMRAQEKRWWWPGGFWL
jgi:hypothetical protein